MLRLTLVMTHQCNLDCKYCLQKHEDVYMPAGVAERSIDNFRRAVLLELEKQGADSTLKTQISFYGGEPLLARERIEQLVHYANVKIGGIPRVSVSYEITTNGLLMDDAFLQFAKENQILLALSHDGLQQSSVRIDRGGNDTRARVDETLKKMLRVFPETIVMMTIHPEYAHLVSDSITFFHDMGVHTISLVLAHGERVTWTDEAFEAFSQQMEKVEVLYEQWNQENGYFRVIPFENKIRNFIRQRDADTPTCHFGCHKLMVDTDGKYYPCTHFIGREGFDIGSQETDVDEEKIASLERQRVEPETCRTCALRPRCHHTCACANHGHTGNVAEVSALQCEYEQLIIRLADQAAAALIKEENKRFVERMYRE